MFSVVPFLCIVAEKLSVYVFPRVTVVVLRLNVNLEPVAERLDHWFICVPSLSVSVIVTLSILVVPDAPVIVTPQVAELPEKDRIKL
jgi:hypothetical protein